MSRLLPLLLLAACKPPPDAPDALDDLCGWLFAHHADEDPEAMQVGLGSLSTWLTDNWEAAAEGVVVTGLEDPVVDALDGQDRSVEAILGVALPTRSTWAAEVAGAALASTGRDQLEPEGYSSYTRTFEGDLDCFLARECPRLEAREEMVVDFGLGIVSTSRAWNQYLWVQVDAGWAMVQRNWLMEPPDVNFDWLVVEEQYNLDLVQPDGDGSLRLQATWMVFQQDDVPEDAALNMAVDEMEDNAANLDAWLAADPASQ